MPFFEIPRGAKRRTQLFDDLPREVPAAVRDLQELAVALPDPQDMSAEQRMGALAGLQVLRNRLEAYQTAVAGAADAEKDSQLYAAGTTGTMIAALTGQNPSVGSGMVGRARDLRDMPVVAAAYLRGELSGRHVGILCEAASQIDRFTDLERQLVDVGVGIEPAALAQIVKVLIEQSRPEHLDEQGEEQRRKQSLSLSELANGMFRLDGYLDPLTGRRMRDALSSCMDRRTPGDERSPKQRRAAALDDLVSMAMASTGRLGVSGLSVLVDIEQLAEGVGARLEDGTPIGPAQFDLLTCASVVSVILGKRRKDAFIPLALGRAARRATSGQWSALIARDRGCVRCGRPPRFCEAHHVVPWRDGGLTDVEAMCLLCSRCHHDLHLGRFTVQMVDGQAECQPTRGRRRRI